MVEVRALVENVLRQGYLMGLGTADQDGPWVADLIYTFDDNLNIYWISDKETRHSAAILRDPRVAATITISDRPNMSNLGLQMHGEARMVEGDIFPMAVKLNVKKGKPAPSKEGEILDKMAEKYGKRHNWFVMKPKRIELLYQGIFGLEKQVLEP